MSDFNIEIESGSSIRLPIAGKYSDKNVVVTAVGGSGSGTGTEDLSQLLSEQERLITELKQTIKTKMAGPDQTYKELYQRVEYIESAETGTYPYIITDFVADNNCGMEVVASFPVLQDRIPMGSRLDSNATRFYVAYPLSSTSAYYGFNTGTTISCSSAVDTIYRLQTNFLNSRLVTVYTENGTRRASTSISATLTQQASPVSIFGYYDAANNKVTSKREFKLYRARCSNKNEVVRDYVPCYRKSDGEVGVYDKCTGQFLISEIEARFAIGPEIDWE